MKLDFRAAFRTAVVATSLAFATDDPVKKQAYQRTSATIPTGEDVSSSDFELNVEAKEKYEQLEPIRLDLKFKNKSKRKFEFDFCIDYKILDFEVVRVARDPIRVPNTSYYAGAKNEPYGGGSLHVPFNEGHVIVYPNLLYDMVWPDHYVVVVVMALRDAKTGAMCVARSKRLNIEIVRRTD